jgi:hypothetical protein
MAFSGGLLLRGMRRRELAGSMGRPRRPRVLSTTIGPDRSTLVRRAASAGSASGAGRWTAEKNKTAAREWGDGLVKDRAPS